MTPATSLGPEPIALPRARLTGERKPVTALFADVVGSVTLAERMDPEDWSQLMSRALGEIEQAVRRYDGSIAKLLGDGVLALFGAETAHEDDPERAVRAAAEILATFERLHGPDHSSAAVDLHIRIGINTGLALVGSVSSTDGDRADMSAYGDTVNVAARLQAAATPGHALIAASTYRLVSHAAEARDLGEIELRGRSEAVHAFELIGLRAAPSSPRGLDGLDSQMVGRGVELDLLRRLVEGLTSGSGCAAVVVGEPGIGKSRLLAELRRGVTETGAARWVEGRARSYGRFQADHLLVDLVRGLAAVVPPGVLADTSALRSLLGDDHVGDDHGAGVDQASDAARADGERPESMRAAYVVAVGALLRAAATSQPLVAVLEDLHWSDASSADTLAQLLPTVVAAPILLLATTRDEPDVPGWRLLDAMRREFGDLHEIALRPLSDDEARTLVADLLDVDALPESLRVRIIARADGNPFFVEETLRMLIDRGALVFREGRWVATAEMAGVEIPETIHGLLLARIDRLPSEPRRTLRVASVIGREFTAPLLAAVLARSGQATADLPAEIGALHAANLVRPVPGSEPPLHRFHHTLVQEAAYDSLLRAERVALHRAAAEALEQSDPNRLDELAARISEHFALAAEPARALPWARRAGEAASGRYALPEAVAQLRRAIDLATALRRPAAELTELYLRAGRATELMDRFDDAIELYESLLATARAEGDRVTELEALAARATGRAISRAEGRDLPDLSPYALEALDLARQLGNRAIEAKALWTLLLTNRFNWGDPDAGIEYGRRSVAIAREIGLDEQAALSAQDLAQSLAIRGDLDEARALTDESVAYWLRTRNLPLASNGLRNRAEIDWLRGDLRVARQTLEQALEIDETTGNTWGRGMSRVTLGSLLVDLGETEAGLAALEEALAIAAPSGLRVLQMNAVAALAGSLVLAGRPDDARPLIEQSRAQTVGVFAVGIIADIPAALLAAVELALGRPRAARAAAEPGVAYNPEQPFAYTVAPLWRAPIEAAIAVGDLAPARAALDPILARTIETGARLWEPGARRLNALLLAAEGEPAAAAHELRTARDVARATGLVHEVAAVERTTAEIDADYGIRSTSLRASSRTDRE